MKTLIHIFIILLFSAAVYAEKVTTPYGESSIDFEVTKLPVYYVIGCSGVPGADAPLFQGIYRTS